MLVAQIAEDIIAFLHRHAGDPGASAQSPETNDRARAAARQDLDLVSNP
jgi:hypothetical protein